MDLYPWQKHMLSGIAKGELKVISMARNTGKSHFSAAALKRLMDDLYKEHPVTDLIVSTGTILGAKYHTVQPIGGSWTSMVAWCKDTFGDPAEIWEAHNFLWPDCGRWYEKDRTFWFRTQKDLDWFILRWRS